MNINATTAIIIAAISFSFYPLLFTIAMETTSNYLLAMLAQILTPILSFLLLCYNVKSVKKGVNLLKQFFKLPLHIQAIPILSGTGIFAGTLFFVFALEMMSKAGATLIMECWPLLAIIIARGMLSDKDWDSFTMIDAVLIFTTLVGMTFISASEANVNFETFIFNPMILFSGKESSELIGVLLAFLAALCFAWGGVTRSYFVTKLSDEWRIKTFGKKESLAEANFTYMMTYIFGIPSAIFCFLMFESNPVEFDPSVILPIFLLAISLISVAVFYAYALLIAKNANINLLWYVAPVLATIWLVLFGYSQLTPLLIAGGFLIIFANLILILTNKQKVKEII